jgi:hypothetical protein
VKLAATACQKPLAKSSKTIQDIERREQERVQRESEILKQLQLCEPATFAVCEAHTDKLVKKMLKLLIAEQSQIIVSGPSHLQLACVMGERTQNERTSFGKVQDTELTEHTIQFIID